MLTDNFFSSNQSYCSCVVNAKCFVGTADATGNEFAITFQSNIVKDAPVSINQIELYVSALEDDTTISVTAPAYTGSNGPNVRNQISIWLIGSFSSEHAYNSKKYIVKSHSKRSIVKIQKIFPLVDLKK